MECQFSLLLVSGLKKFYTQRIVRNNIKMYFIKYSPPPNTIHFLLYIYYVYIYFLLYYVFIYTPIYLHTCRCLLAPFLNIFHISPKADSLKVKGCLAFLSPSPRFSIHEGEENVLPPFAVRLFTYNEITFFLQTSRKN